MTRINLDKPSVLTDQHLLAEIRELPRIFTYVEKYGIDKSRIPDEYCLGNGHVLFFTDKLWWLTFRYMALTEEWSARGFSGLNNRDEISQSMACTVLDHWDDLIDYTATQEEIEISRQRITEKISAKPGFYRHNRVLLQ